MAFNGRPDRGRKLYFLLEQEYIVLEHESSCQSMTFVLGHDQARAWNVVLWNNLVRARARILSWSDTNLIVLGLNSIVLDHKLDRFQV